MPESVNARVNRLADGIDRQELRFLLASVVTDLNALKTSLNQLITDYNANTNIGTDTTATAVTLNTQS
jgi:DNA polymerase III delta subunit